MAKINFDKDVTGTTGRGAAYWAKVTKLSEHGKYELNLHLADEQANEMFATLQPLLDDAVKLTTESGKTGFNVAELHKGQDDKGRYIFKFKNPELSKNGTSQKPKFFDKFGKHIQDWDALIGNESVIKVQFWAKPYHMASSNTVGISMRMNAIQVIDLVEYGAGGGGFGDESDDGSAPFTPDTPNEDF